MRGGREGEEGTQRGIAVRQQTKALFEVSVERRNVCVFFVCVRMCVRERMRSDCIRHERNISRHSWIDNESGEERGRYSKSH